MRHLLVLMVLVLAACAMPQSTPVHGSPDQGLAGLQPATLPDYDSDRGIGWAASREDYAAARADGTLSVEQFTYVSDGLTVGAYLFRARGTPPRPLPVIVFNRGSFVRPKGFAGEMLVMARRYVQAGYIVVAPHYRGSNGWAGKDELGGADLHDLMNIVPELKKIPGADTSHVYLSGESRGGAMVYMALRDGFPARAAAVWGAFTDLEPLSAPGAPLEKMALYVWPELATRREEIVRSRSAVYWAEKINTPVLIMHGGADEDMPVSQSQRLDAELTRLGKPHDLIVFEGQQHVIGGRGAERDAAAIAWFRKYGR